MSPVGIAIVGGGIFIREEHVPAVLASNDLLSVKAIYSRSLKSAQDTAAILKDSHGEIDLYSQDSGDGKTFKDILKRSDVVGVIIALPIMNQPEYIKQALEAGKHVLAEKPVGPDVASAKKMIQWYREHAAPKGTIWAVAEQFRYIQKYQVAAAEARQLGKVTGCFFKVFYMIKEDDKYFGTEWRKNPTHDYGFILDAGVHFVAALRQLIGSDDKPETVVAFSHTAASYLPAPDSLHGVIKLNSGALGSVLLSVGSTFRASEYAVSCEQGSVTIAGDVVTVLRKDGSKEEKEIAFNRGVKEEVRAWAQAIQSGQADKRQSPEEALADLELLESLLSSAGENGAQRALTCQ